jgi:hypothetical protein
MEIILSFTTPHTQRKEEERAALNPLIDTQPRATTTGQKPTGTKANFRTY